MIADAKVEYIEAFEALVSNQYVELLAWMRDWASKNMRDEETIGKVQALIRDQGRSVLSGHTCIGGADQLHIHHIVPRGYFGPERPEKIHDPSNLATVTRAEHEEIHRDWRAWVPRLREAIG